MALTIVHPRALAGIPDIESNTKWIYADDDPTVAAVVLDRLGEGRRQVAPNIFQEYVSELRDEFVVWLDSCLIELQPDEWLPTSYFKDIFSSQALLHMAWLGLIAESVKANVIVVTAQASLAKQLRQMFKSSSVSVIGRQFFVLDTISKGYLSWRHFFLRPLRFLLSMCLARWSLGTEYKQSLVKSQVIVNTFLLPGDLLEDGTYRDRYMPGLIDYYRSLGLEVASLPETSAFPIRDLFSMYRGMRKSSAKFIPLELYLRFHDVFAGQLKSIWAIWHAPDFKDARLRGMDVHLIANDWWRISILRTVIPRIMVSGGRRVRGSGLTPALLLIWYENQAVHKALNIAFSGDDHQTKVVAVRQYFPVLNVISFFSTYEEVRHGVSPSINWACGRRTAELFAHDDALGEYCYTPALRYSGVDGATTIGVEGQDLVIFLTSSLGEAIAILECAMSNIEAVISHFSAIRIKAHQALNVDMVALARRRWPAIDEHSVHWENANSETLLRNARLVLTAGSSAAVEAVCMGVPVVVVGRSAGITVNPLEDIDPDIWRLVYCNGEFVDLLLTWLPSVPSFVQRCAFGSKIRDIYFHPVSCEGMRSFLPNNICN